MRIRSGRILVGGFLFLALAGCSSNPTSRTEPISGFSITASASPSSAPEGRARDVNCTSLATASEVSEVVGTKVTGPKSASPASAGVPGLHAVGCNYTGSGALVLFIVGTVPDAGTARLIFEQLKRAQTGEDVLGVGDHAFFAPDSDTLVAVQGSTFLNLTVAVRSLGDKSAERAAAVKLGRQVIGRVTGS